jgi:DNA-binding transcriptional LysR family regulator
MSSTSTPLLDLSLLQTLAAVQHTGTLAKAAEQVGRTQSAVSLQMQRLEQSLALDLFDRRGRSLVLTEAGQAMLGYAQQMLALNRQAVAAVRGHRVAGRVRLGMSVDFEHTWLPRTMARFAQSHPKIVVDLRVDRNSALEHAVARQELDIALVFSGASSAQAKSAAQVPMRWLASRNLAWQAPQPVPLLLLASPCMFREAAITALDKASLPWRVAVTSQSLGGVWATARAHMGVTARTGVSVPEGLVDIGQAWGLPVLPSVAVRVVEAGGKGSAPRVTLRRMLEGVVEELVEAR